MRLRPSRSPRRPARSNTPPNGIRYALTTQARLDCEKPRSRWIDGRATLTMVWSRMIISIPAHSTTSAGQRDGPGGVRILQSYHGSCVQDSTQSYYCFSYSCSYNCCVCGAIGKGEESPGAQYNQW